MSAAFLLLAAAGAGTAAGAKTVTTRGGFSVEPNQYVQSNLRFAPGTITVRPGERVTWVDRDQAPEPHTVTVVSRRNLPDTLDEVFECETCALALGHLNDPEDPEAGIKTVRLNVGRPGLDRQGDSLFLASDGRISARVSARAGRTLHYLCAIHPWMQGHIRVRAAGAAPGPALTGRHH